MTSPTQPSAYLAFRPVPRRTCRPLAVTMLVLLLAVLVLIVGDVPEPVIGVAGLPLIAAVTALKTADRLVIADVELAAEPVPPLV